MKNIQKQNNQNINMEYPSFLTSAIEQVEKTKKEVEEAILPILPTIEILKENKIFLDRVFKKEEPVMLTKYINPEREILNEAREIKELIKDKNTNKELEYFNKNYIIFNGKIYKPFKKIYKDFINELKKKHQKENNNGTVLNKGERMPEKLLSNKLGISIKSIREIKKGVNRSFRDKEFPLRIDTTEEGLLLIHTI
ncbi:MAG: hypothetical protein MCSN_3430 [Candidatus Microsyncoccus archaeolyticus]|nr:MAG: hypothetical protein MCSN_3430 [Candidatus Parcubacteria bacterium]